MASNMSIACSFASITSVISQADNGNLNISQLVDSCPQICSLAWGTGNPDLSGIGVFSSPFPLPDIIAYMVVDLHLLYHSADPDLDLWAPFHLSLVGYEEMGG